MPSLAAPCDAPVTPKEPTPGLLLQMITTYDEKHEEGHHRLRSTCREHEGWMRRHDRELQELMAAVAALKATPPEVTKLRFSPSIVLGIVTISISIAAGIWASTYSLRSDVRDLVTKYDLAAKLADERAAGLKESIEAIKRRQELQQYDIQDLKNVVTGAEAKKR